MINSIRCIGIGALLVGGLACNTDVVYAPMDPDPLWSITLNTNAVTLSTVAPYDTLQLTATMRTVSGKIRPDLVAAWTTSDSTISITKDGLLKALDTTTKFAYVVAKAVDTVSNQTIRDTVLVWVTADAHPVALAQFAFRPFPGDSAWVAFNGVVQKNLQIVANDANGVSRSTNFPVGFRSEDRSRVSVVGHSPSDTVQVATFAANTVVTLFAKTTYYGRTFVDSLRFRTGWPIYSGVVVRPVDGIAGSDVARAFSPDSITIATGGTVQFIAMSGNISAGLDRSAIPSPDDSSDWESISTDTGAFAQGRKTFERYTIPMCIAAARNTRLILQRSVSAQLARYQHPLLRKPDTTVANEQHVARTCGQRFTVEGTAREDLANFFTLAVLEKDDSLSLAIIGRLISVAPDSLKTEFLQQAVRMALSGHPARESLAKTLVARIDASKPTDQLQRMKAHQQLLSFYWLSFDQEKMRAEIEQVLRFSQPVPTSVQSSDYRIAYGDILVNAYARLLDIAYYAYPDSLLPIASRAQQTFSKVPIPEQHWERFRDMPAKDVLALLSYSGKEKIDNAEKPYPALRADAWFPKPLSSSDTGERPITLFVSTYNSWVVANENEGYYGWDRPCQYRSFQILFEGNRCAQLAEYVRGWNTLYGGQGLRIVVYAVTSGTALRSLSLSPEKEMERLAWYFLDYLKLPVTVAVEKSPVEILPAPDSRRRYGETPDRDLYGAPNVVLLGHQGELLYTGHDGPLFDRLLSRVMSESASRVKPGDHTSNDSSESLHHDAK